MLLPAYTIDLEPPEDDDEADRLLELQRDCGDEDDG